VGIKEGKIADETVIHQKTEVEEIERQEVQKAEQEKILSNSQKSYHS
jgi:hypothetical protein